MRRLILLTIVLALAAGGTASAMGSDRTAGNSGRQVGGFHSAALAGSHRIKRSGRLAGPRAPQSWYPGGGTPGADGGFIDLGPLGMTAACGSYRHGNGPCASGYGTPIDAWSY